MQVQTVHLKDTFPFLGQEDRDPVLNVYIQNTYSDVGQTPRKRPGILLCPGGAYRGTAEREGEPVALRLLPMGCNVFVLHYSVLPHRFPTQLQEVAAALELIAANAEAWDTDTEKLALMGFSAGGHLAAHYTNLYDCPEVRQVLPDSKPVQATILGYPVITADEKYCHKGSIANVSGCAYPLDAQTVAKFSCDQLVTEKTPPAFIWHTAADQWVPVANSLLYAQALADYKIPFSLHIYPHGPHGLATADGQTNESMKPSSQLAQSWLTDLERWLKNLFG